MNAEAVYPPTESGSLRTNIAAVAQGLGLSQFDLKYSVGTLSHEQLMKSVELTEPKSCRACEISCRD